jgi:hypothetical protein
MVCEWSLYKITEEDLKDFIGTIPVDLSKHYENYINKLKKKSKDYLTLLNNQLIGQ